MFGDKRNKWCTSQNQNQVISFHKTLKIDKVHCTNKYTSHLGVQYRANLLPMSLKPLPSQLHGELCEIFYQVEERGSD